MASRHEKEEMERALVERLLRERGHEEFVLFTFARYVYKYGSGRSQSRAGQDGGLHRTDIGCCFGMLPMRVC